MTYKQLNHYGKVRNVIVERCGRTYEAYHTMDHGTTAICDTIIEAKEAVDDLARQHNTIPLVKVIMHMTPEGHEALMKYKEFLSDYGVKRMELA